MRGCKDQKHCAPIFFISILCGLSLVACNGLTSHKPIEVKRVPSNTGMFDAILYRYNDSVIDDHPLILTIVSKGAKVPEKTARYPKDYALLMAEGVIPESLTWSTDDKVITISYQAGQNIFSFKNHAYMELPRGGLPWLIEVALERVAEIPAKK